MSALSAAVAGIVFAIGLALAGMTQPAKVLAFLDVAGDWDPSLAFVMGGAIAVYAPLYHFITRRTMPWYAQQFVVVTDRRLDARLLAGAALFGVGWGLAGFCPGPALTAAGTFSAQPLLFVASMVAGMFAHRAFEALRVRVSNAKGLADA